MFKSRANPAFTQGKQSPHTVFLKVLKSAYDTLYSQTGAPMQNTEKNIFIISNKFWVPNLGFLRA